MNSESDSPEYWPVSGAESFVVQGHLRADCQLRVAEIRSGFQADMAEFYASDLAKISESIATALKRLDRLEEAMRTLQEQVQASRPSSAMKSPTTKRSRRTALSLQSKIRRVHKSFNKEKQLRPHEAMTSEHNSDVVKQITKEIGGSMYSEHEIQVGISTYRRTLKRAISISTASSRSEANKRLVRSRQQRLWERRSKVLLATEKEKWQLMQPTMMSEEEDEGDGRISIRKPDWRSEELNEWISELDARASSISKSARKVRVPGYPLRVPPPTGLPAWMIRT
eukprot:Em0017g582a